MKLSILVPYDFGPEADRALHWAAEMVRTGDAMMRVVHFVPLAPSGLGEMPSHRSAPESDDLEGIRAELQARVDATGVQGYAFAALVPHVAEAIIARAKGLGSNLIVMGTRGHGGVKRLLLGSTADHVIRHSDVPVLTVR